MKLQTETTPEGFVANDGVRTWLRNAEGWHMQRADDGTWLPVTISAVPARCLVEFCEFAAIRERVKAEL